MDSEKLSSKEKIQRLVSFIKDFERNDGEGIEREIAPGGIYQSGG